MIIVTKFHENRLTIDREINEKHKILGLVWIARETYKAGEDQ